jgi:hypothetical protein
MTRFVVISGIDGCGKTTVIDRLQQRLERRGIKTRYEWLRYNHRLARPVHAIARLVGLSRRHEVDGRTIWRHEFYRSRWFSSFYIALTWLDVLIGRWLVVRRAASHGIDIVLCDRWMPDILVDLAVDTRRRSLLDGKWRSRFSRILPAGTKQYLVVRRDGSIVSCRPDVTRDMSLSFRRRLYRRLERRPDLTVVTNDGTMDEAADAILSDLELEEDGLFVRHRRPEAESVRWRLDSPRSST